MARPRAFDLDLATDRALQLFWSKGYEGTTLGDLTEAMGINRPSLYAAFGSKEGLFQKALERYLDGPGASILVALQADTAREAAHRILLIYADAVKATENPRGCFLVQGALVCGDENASIRALLTEKRHFAEAALVTRLERGKRDGDLSASVDSSALSRYVWTVCQGMSVQAAGGATHAQLREIVEFAMRAWPG